MALQFLEQTESYTIPLEIAQRAIAILAEAEKRMHYALMFGGRNPLNVISRKILQLMFTTKRAFSMAELLDHFNEDLREMELVECMRFMIATGKVVYEGQRYSAKLNNMFTGINSSKPKEIEPLKALPLDEPLPPSDTIIPLLDDDKKKDDDDDEGEAGAVVKT